MKKPILVSITTTFSRYSLLAMLAAGFAVTQPAYSGPDTSPATPMPLRQSFDVRIPMPPSPVAVAGERMLVYELQLANFSREPLILEQVEVVDQADGILARFRGEDLQARLNVPASGTDGEDNRAVGPGTNAVLYVELSLGEAAAPAALAHRIAYRTASDPEGPTLVLQVDEVSLSAEAPPVLSPPLRGGPWAAVYGPSWERGHRRMVYAVAGQAHIPGRFAVDWVKLDESGRKARGDENEIANWYGDGADVLAVADGVVATVRDDVTESPTLSGHPDHPLEDGTGNYIALSIGNGRYAFYEHLKPGSLRVEAGQHIRRGEVIAAVGFTGHSMGPHLHFHVANAKSPLDAEGIPFALERFEVLGRYEGFDATAGIPWTLLDGDERSVHVDELPAPNVVVDFGAD